MNLDLNLGETCDRLYAMKAEIAVASAVVTELEAQKKDIENRLMEAMNLAGTNIARGKTATVSISETVRPQLQDWEEFTKFVARRKAFHLFEKRIAANAYKEMKELLGGKPIPGVTEFTQNRLNINKL